MDKEIKSLIIGLFDEKYGSFELCEIVNKKDRDKLVMFLETIITALTELPEKEFESGDIIEHNSKRFDLQSYKDGYNTCLTDTQQKQLENIKKL